MDLKRTGHTKRGNKQKTISFLCSDHVRTARAVTESKLSSANPCLKYQYIQRE